MYNPFKRIKELEAVNELKTKEIEFLKAIAEENVEISPEKVIEKIFARGLDWYDYNELGFSDRMAYWNDARAILNNNVFLNEYNHFIAKLIKEMAKDLNVEQIKYARFGIVALEAFKDHLESINNPSQNETFEEINEGI